MKFAALAGAIGALLVGGSAWLVSRHLVPQTQPVTQGYEVQIEPVHVREPPKSAIPFLSRADVRRGKQTFRFCSACHSVSPGGAHGIGPNLHGVMGRSIAAAADYRYSPALVAKRGERWHWDNMDPWLAEPRRLVPGTKMVFAGVLNPQDRADLLLYLNEQGGALPLPGKMKGGSPREE